MSCELSEILASAGSTYILLSLIYLVFSVFAIIRLKTTYSLNSKNCLGSAFYFSLFLLCCLRLGCFITSTVIVARWQENFSDNLDKANKILMILLYFPETIFWILFFFFFWELLVLLYSTHINYDIDTVVIPLRRKNVFIGLTILIAYFLLQLIAVLSYRYSMGNVEDYILLHGICNIALSVLIMVFELRLHNKFSGLPYKSIRMKNIKINVNKRVFYWVFARSLQGIIDIIFIKVEKFDSYLRIDTDATIIDDTTYYNMIGSLMIMMVEKVFFELIPIFLILNNELVYNLSHLHEQCDFKESKEALNATSDDIKCSRSTKSTNFKEIDDFIIDSNTLKKKVIKPKTNKYNLGVIYLSEIDVNAKIEKEVSFFSNEVLIRQVDLPNVSTYIKEYVIRDCKLLYSLQLENNLNLAILKGVSFNANKIDLIYENYSNGSLSNLIHSNKGLEIDLKLKIAFDIAKSLNSLLSVNPPISHGHLTPHNILLDKEFFPKITDLLFFELKKYCAISLGYSNKSHYSAPEILAENGAVVTNAKEKSDVYSFGLIFWEILTENFVFQDVKKDQLKKIVVEDDFRPKIPENIPAVYANMIRCCWQKEIEKRPTFSQIVKIFENHLNFRKALSGEAIFNSLIN